MKPISRNRNIDFIKGLAIFGIVLCHASQIIPDINVVIKKLCQLGQLGCQVFFFLTGYLLFYKFNKQFTSPFCFVKKNIGGVIVPWLLVIVTYLLITQFISIPYQLPFKTKTEPLPIIINILFLNGIIPSANNNVVLGGWYMGTLFIIWCLYPYLFKMKNKFGNKSVYAVIAFSLITMITTGLTFGYNYIARNTFLYFSFINNLPVVLIGMLYADYENKKLQKPTNNKILQVTKVITTATLLSILFYLALPFSAIFTPILTSILLIQILPIINIEYKDNFPCRILEKAGRDSLYIYLFHVFIVYHFQFIVYKWVTELSQEFNPTLMFLFLLPFEYLLIALISNVIRIINTSFKTLFNLKQTS